MSQSPQNNPQDYSNGTYLAQITSIVLLISSLLFAWLAVQARRGDDGTEFLGIYLAPVWYGSIIIILGSLLSTAFRRIPVPPKVRKVRLIWSVVGLLSIAIPFLVK